MVQPDQARWDVDGERGEDVKLERSPSLNLVRAERSDCHVFAYVERTSEGDIGTAVEKSVKEDHRVKKIGNISKVASCSVVHVARLNDPNGFTRGDAVMELDLLPGESRRYWKNHAPSKWFQQAKASGKVNNDRANLLNDTGAEISILDIAFARKVGCQPY